MGCTETSPRVKTATERRDKGGTERRDKGGTEIVLERVTLAERVTESVIGIKRVIGIERVSVKNQQQEVNDLENFVVFNQFILLTDLS